MAISVNIINRYSACAGQHARKIIRGFLEIAAAIVDVEPVLKKGIFRQEIPIATTGHIKIQVPIAIGIKKHRVSIFTSLIRFEVGKVGSGKGAIAALDKQLPGNSSWIS